MTLQECYAALGGDYEDVLGRLRSERLIQKFVLKFLDDGSYDLLTASMEAGSWEEAFRAAHTIKGMCQNLSFTKLLESDSALTEALRGEADAEAARRLKEQVDKDYKQVADSIKAFQAGL